MSKSNSALICAFEIRNGIASALTWDNLAASPSPKAWRWIHLDRAAPEARSWLRSRSALPALAVQVLLAGDSRPRFVLVNGCALAVLKGLAGEHAARKGHESLASLAIWIEDNRVVTVQGHPLLALAELREKLGAGEGPKTPGDFIARLAEAMASGIHPLIAALQEKLDVLETGIETRPPDELRAQLAVLRRKAMPLRRHLSPQRDALSALAAAEADWLDQVQRAHLHEASDQIVHCLEDVDAVRERAILVSEELSARLSEKLNRSMYWLTLIATLFLPLGVIAGMLGANVGGIPFGSDPLGFWWWSAILVVLGGAGLWILRGDRG